MRTLMIAAATAAALMAGSAYAAGSGTAGSQTPSTGTSSDRVYDDSVQPNYGSGSTESPGGWTGEGSSGSSIDDSAVPGSGSTYDGTAPLEATPSSPSQDQTGTGTHCPPGRPDCGPDGG